MADATIKFDGQRFSTWERVSIRDSVDDLCSAVNMTVASPGVGTSLGMSGNTVVGILAEDNLVTTVRPDSLSREVDATSHILNLEARSLGRELVDCQYSITLSGLKLGEIVKRICSVFKVPVKIDAETAVVPQFAMQCEVPANALINAVRASNLLLYPLPDGGLILTSPSSKAPVATLEYGYQIKRYQVVDEYKLRFSEYIIKTFDYDDSGFQRSHVGKVKDPGFTYFRPMHIVADRHSQGGIGGCQRRAELERNRRLARAHRIELTVSGWRHATDLWQINTQVRVIIPQEEIDGVFLIGDRHFSLDDKGGKITVLNVMHRNAFLGEEKKKTKRGAGIKKAKS